MDTYSGTKVQKIRYSYKRIVSIMSAIVLITLGSLPARAQITIEYPNDTDATIQDAINRAGCGGTVFLAAGTYTGSQLSTEPGPDYTEGHILILCGTRLIGAGIDDTIIDGSNSPSPSLGTPVIGLGFHPFIIQPVTENYEVANLTVKTLTAVTTPQAIAIGWANNVHLHHLKIEGFSTAIRADLSNDVEIDHVTVQGQGADVGRCIEFRERGVFFSSLPGGHMTGNSVHHNELSNCLFGINLNNNDEASIEYNTIRDTGTGIQFRGVDNSSFHHNTIENSTLRGLNLVNVNDSSFGYSTYCQDVVGVRYGASSLPSLFGHLPSSGNTVHHQTLIGNGDVIRDEDPNDGGGNTKFKNKMDPDGSCPAP